MQMIEGLITDFAKVNEGPPQSILVFRYTVCVFLQRTDPTMLEPRWGRCTGRGIWFGDLGLCVGCRDGVSESQFAHVKETEVQAFKNVAEELSGFRIPSFCVPAVIYAVRY